MGGFGGPCDAFTFKAFLNRPQTVSIYVVNFVLATWCCRLCVVEVSKVKFFNDVEFPGVKCTDYSMKCLEQQI